jgi:hypothetical protein
MEDTFLDRLRKEQQIEKLRNEIRLREQNKNGFVFIPKEDESFLDSLRREQAERRQYEEQQQFNPNVLHENLRKNPFFTPLDVRDKESYDVNYNDPIYGDLIREGKINPAANHDMWEKIGYENQTFGQRLGYTAAGLGINVLSGFMNNLASIDPTQLVDAATEDDNSVEGNFLNTVADLIKKQADHFYLFKDMRTPDAFFSWNNLGGQIQNFGYTLGIAAEQILETVAISALTEGAGLATAPARVASAVGKIARLYSAGKKGQAALKIGLNVAKNAALGAWQGAREGIQNAREMGSELYKELMASGRYTEEEAKKIAAKAITENFYSDLGPLMLIQAAQTMALGAGKLRLGKAGVAAQGTIAEQNMLGSELRNIGRGFGVSGTINGIYDPLLNKIKNKIVRNAVGYVAQAGSESLEEAWQTGVNKHVGFKYKFDNGLASYDEYSDVIWGDGEMVQSMVGGALGGLVFAGAAHARRGIDKRRNDKRIREINRVIENTTNKTIQAVIKFNEMAAGMTQDQREALMPILLGETTWETMHAAMQIDAIRGDNSAFDAHVSLFNSALEAARNNDREKLKALGLENVDNQFILDHFEKQIEIAKRTYENFSNAYNKYRNQDLAMYLAQKKFDIEQLRMREGLNADFLADYREQVTANLSDEDKAAFAHLSNLTEQQQRVTTLENYINSKEFGNLDKEQQEAIQKLYEQNKKQFEDLQNSNVDTSNVQHLVTISKDVQDAMIDRINFDIQIAQIQAEHNKWDSYDKVQSFIEYRIRQAIAASTESEDLIALRKRIKREHIRLSSVEMRELDKKISDALEREKQAAQTPQNNAQGNNQTQTQNNSQTQVSTQNAAQTQNSTQAQSTTQQSSNLAQTQNQSTTTTASSTQQSQPVNATNTPAQSQAVNTQAQSPFESITQDENWLRKIEEYDSLLHSVNPLTPDEKKRKANLRKALRRKGFLDKYNQLVAQPSNSQTEQIENDKEKARQQVADELIAVMTQAQSEANQGVTIVDDEELPFAEESVQAARSSQEENSPYFVVSDQNLMFSQSYDEYAESFHKHNAQAAFNDESKAVLSRAVQLIQEEIGHEPSFQEVVGFLISHTKNKERLKFVFMTLQHAWEISGRTPSNYKQVFEQYFSTAQDIVDDLARLTEEHLSNTLNGTTETATEVRPEEKPVETPTQATEVREESHSVEETEVSPQPNGTAIMRTVSTVPKVHLDTVESTVEDEVLVDSTENRVNDVKLNEEYDIDLSEVLPQNKLNPGTTVRAVVPENYMDLTTPIYNPNTGEFIRTVKFKDFITVYNSLFGTNINENSQEYIDAIPMVYQNEQGKNIGIVKTVGWYNTNNVGYENDAVTQQQVIQEAQNNTRELRTKAFTNGKSGLKLTVIEKSSGHIQRTRDGQQKPLSEIAPHSKLAIVRSVGVFEGVNGNVNEEGQTAVVADEAADKVGTVVEVREGVNTSENLVLRCTPQPVGKSQLDSIRHALMAYLMHARYQTNTGSTFLSAEIMQRVFGEDYTTAMQVTASMQEKSQGTNGRLNFANYTDLNRYISAFVYLQTTSIEDFFNNPKIANGTLFFSIEKGTITIGIKGISEQFANQYGLIKHPNFQDSYYLKFNQFTYSDIYNDPSLSGLSEAEKEVQAGNIFMNKFENMMSFLTDKAPRVNTSLAMLRGDYSFALIDEDGVVQNKQDYEQFQKGFYTSNVLEEELGNGAHTSLFNPAIYVAELGNEDQARETRETERQTSIPQRALRNIAAKLVANKELTPTEQTIYEEHKERVERLRAKWSSENQVVTHTAPQQTVQSVSQVEKNEEVREEKEALAKDKQEAIRKRKEKLNSIALTDGQQEITYNNIIKLFGIKGKGKAKIIDTILSLPPADLKLLYKVFEKGNLTSEQLNNLLGADSFTQFTALSKELSFLEELAEANNVDLLVANLIRLSKSSAVSLARTLIFSKKNPAKYLQDLMTKLWSVENQTEDYKKALAEFESVINELSNLYPVQNKNLRAVIRELQCSKVGLRTNTENVTQEEETSTTAASELNRSDVATLIIQYLSTTHLDIHDTVAGLIEALLSQNLTVDTSVRIDSLLTRVNPSGSMGQLSHVEIEKLGRSFAQMYLSKQTEETLRKLPKEAVAQQIGLLVREHLTNTKKKLLELAANANKIAAEDTEHAEAWLRASTQVTEELVGSIDNALKDVIEQSIADVETFLGIDLSTELTDEDTTLEEVNAFLDEDLEQALNVRDYSKSSLETNHRRGMPIALRLALSTVAVLDENGQPKEGLFGTQEYVPVDTVITAIEEAISSEADIESDIKKLLERMEQKVGQYPFLRTVIDNVNRESQQFQNMFTYQFAKHILTVKMVLAVKNADGTITYNTIDANGVRISQMIAQAWSQQMRNSNLWYADINGDIRFNKEKGKQLLDRMRAFQDAVNKAIQEHQNKPRGTAFVISEQIDLEELRDIFLDLGMDLNTKTLENILLFGLPNSKNKQTVDGLNSVLNFFRNKKGSLFASLEDFVEKNVNKSGEALLVENTDTDPTYNISGLLRKFSQVEGQHREVMRTRSFRDGDKTFNGFTNSMMAHDLLYKLLNTQDKTMLKQYLSMAFTKNSMVLQIVDQNPELARNIAIEHVANTAFKKDKSRSGANGNIAQLTNADKLLYQFGLFHSDKLSAISLNGKTPTFMGFVLRMGRIMFPTLSDKSTSLIFNSFAVELENSDFEIDKSGEVSVRRNDKRNIHELLFSQVVQPELSRIIQFAMHRKNGKAVNCDGLNDGSRIFYMLPALNNIMVTQQNGESIRFIEALDQYGEQIPEDLMHQFKEQSYDVIDNYMRAEVARKIALLQENGTLQLSTGVDAAGKSTSPHLDLDKAYKEKFEVTNSEVTDLAAKLLAQAQLLAYDLTINEMIGIANQNMMIVGDLALFSKEKLGKNFDGSIYNPTQANSYENFVRTTESNLGKRLAQLVAPGIRLANCETPAFKHYYQVVLQDRVAVSDNYGYITEVFYGKEARKYAEEQLDRFYKSTDPAEQRDILGDLSEKYPKIAPYLENAETDAQEYTTAIEHVEILFRQGRMADDVYQSCIKKLRLQTRWEIQNPNQPIPQKLLLTQEELKSVLQPIKPVYNGVVVDNDLGVARTMYVKTSSYPLIPQLTAGLEINKLRLALEKMQFETNRYVRAAYHSGVKVGATKSKIKIWNENGTFNEEVTTEKLLASAVLLDRSFFRIQQDIPYEGHMEVALMTQMKKLLFGNGITEITDFEYNGKKLTGRELYNLFNEINKEMIELRKSELYNELGLDEHGELKSENIEKFGKALEKILQTEALTRGFTEQEVTGLKIKFVQERVKDANGKERLVIKDVVLNMPLFFASNHQRIETMMQAIVTSRVINQKLPGYSFIAASEAGYRVDDSVGNLSANQQSRIIYTDSFDGELHGVQENENQTKPTRLRSPKRSIPYNGAVVEVDGHRYIYSKYTRGQHEVIDLESNKLVRLEKSTSFNVVGEYQVASLKDRSYIITDSDQIIDLVSRAVLEPKAFSQKERNILFSQVERIPKNWKPKTGVRKVQVLLPAKFRNEKGELISFFNNDKTPNEKYVTVDKEGRLRLKKGMIEEELLSQIMCRIPTGSHVSMCAMEVAGFLPPECGDLVILPKGLTTQKGLDFDIDKEHTYQLHTYVEPETGKIRVYRGTERRKVLENEFIRIHKAILSSTNPEVQRKILKPLSIAFAKEQASEIEKKLSQNLQNQEEGHSVLSSTLQARKLENGAIGRVAIGIYANGLTLNGQIQVAEKPIQFMERTENGEGKKENKPITLRFGQIVSDGKLGRLNAIEHDVSGTTRTISEILDEALNLATDNAKEEALTKLGVTLETINDHVMTILLGFDKCLVTTDKGRQEMSIPFMLLNQPIIKRLVEYRKANNAVMSAALTDEQILQKLTDEFGISISAEVLNSGNYVRETQRDGFGNNLEGQNLYDNVGSFAPSQKTQEEALIMFLALEQLSDRMRSINKISGIESKGLGKTYWDYREKKEIYNNFYDIETSGDIVIPGIHQLLFRVETYTDSNGNEKKKFVPNTPLGYLLQNGFEALEGIYANLLPYEDNIIRKMFNAVVYMSTASSKFMQTRIMEQAHNALKQFVNSIDNIGLWNNSQVARRDLFFEYNENSPNGNLVRHQSLAGYLSSILQSNTHLAEVLSKNAFLQRLSFDVNLQHVTALNSISTIAFSSGLGSELNESYISQAIEDLYDNDYELPAKNGKPYTSRQLINDLLAYSLLSGNTNGVTSFMKYIPSRILEQTDYYRIYDTLNNQSNEKLNSYSRLIRGDQEGGVNPFLVQFFQHNSHLLSAIPYAKLLKVMSKYTSSRMQNGEFSKGFNDIVEFTVPSPWLGDFTEKDTPFMIVIEFERGGKPVRNVFLLENVIGKGSDEQCVYRRVPTLGTQGMSEYNQTAVREGVIAKSNLEGNNPEPAVQAEATSEQITRDEKVDEFGLLNKKVSLSQVFMNILSKLDKKNPLRPVIQFLVNNQYLSTTTKIEVIEESEWGNVPERVNTAGYYDSKNNTIYVRSKFLQDGMQNKLAKLITHEMLHAITSKFINDYTTIVDGQYVVKQGAPKSIISLLNVYSEVKRRFADKITEYRQGDKQASRESFAVGYGTLNLHEFITAALTEPDFQKLLAEVEYKSSGKSFWEKFVDIIQEIFDFLNVSQENSLSAFSISAALKVVRDASNNQNNVHPTLENGVIHGSIDYELLQAQSDVNEVGIPTEEFEENKPVEQLTTQEKEDITFSIRC